MAVQKAMDKIRGDFDGALPYWKEHFDLWTFVHNAIGGLSAPILKLLLDIGRDYKEVTIGNWGPPELRIRLFELDRPHIVKVLGAIPSRKDFAQVPFESLRLVLQIVGRQIDEGLPDLRPVPADKLAANALSKGTEKLLQVGMSGTDRLGSFFRQYHEPQLGDQIAARFRSEYARLRSSGLTANQIFRELQIFASGTELAAPDEQAAVLVVLAYLFEQCDIYERPRV
jgi:hypothetical protein